MLTYKEIEELDADTLFQKEKHSVGPGWLPLIEKAHAALLKSSPDYKPVQIKEKFGSLRFYVQGVEYGTPAYEAIIEAERLSEKTCEECGEPAEVKSVEGWLRCLCDEHLDEALERRRGGASDG